MEITREEAEVIKSIIVKHLEGLRKNEITVDAQLPFLSAEKKYEEFLENLLKKLK